MIAVALGVGFGLSYYALTDGRFFGVAQAGPWIAWPDVGSSSPNPYTRGHLARAGVLQLGQSEGLQFTASVDNQGEPLDLACNYHLTGKTPLATFWTLVAVDADGVNLARPGIDPAIRSTSLARDSEGGIDLYVGKRLSPQNWLELTGEGQFTLALTLYDTAVLSGVSSDSASMPTITRVDCA